MKTQMKEVITFEQVFVSKDGKEFKTEADCRKWENSYECTMEASFGLIPKTTADAIALGFPFYDAETYIIKPRHLDDIVIINAYMDAVAYEVYDHLSADHIGKVIALVFGYGRECAHFYVMANHIEEIVTYLDKKLTEIEKGEN